MSTLQGRTTGVTKKHTRSRGRAKLERAQDPYDSAYGNLPWGMFRIRPWTYAKELDEATVGKHVMVYGEVMQVRPLSRTSAIVVLYDDARSVRCMVNEGVTTRMVGFAATLPRGTLIDVEGVVSPPGSGKDILATTQKVEIQVRRLHAIGTRKDGSSQRSSDISS